MAIVLTKDCKRTIGTTRNYTKHVVPCISQSPCRNGVAIPNVLTLRRCFEHPNDPPSGVDHWGSTVTRLQTPGCIEIAVKLQQFAAHLAPDFRRNIAASRAR